MDLKRYLLKSWRGGAFGTALILGVGLALLLWPFRLSQSLTRASYDWSLDLSSFSQPDVRQAEVVLVYLDEDSHKELDQPLNLPWDRKLHARLLDRLAEEGARAVVFDVIFSDDGPDPIADNALETAIRENGRVILGADYSYSGTVQGPNMTVSKTLTLPLDRFRHAAAGWGLAVLELDQDFTVRKHFNGFLDDDLPNLSWATLKLVDPKNAALAASPPPERWLRYYGGPQTLPHVSYAQALRRDGVSPGFFHNKVVYVGARPMTGTFIERRDELRSPLASWGHEFLFMPAVEVHATQTLNLLRGDWLTRLSPGWELSLIAIAAVALGFGLPKFKPLQACCVALGTGLLLTLAAVLVVAHARVWFPWMIIVVAQLPVGLLWSISFKSIEWYVQRRQLEQERKRAELRIREQAALLDKAQDAIFVQDLSGRITYANASSLRLYGWTQPETAALKDRTPDPEPTAKAAQVTLQNGEWLGELQQTNQAGAKITVQSRWTLLRDEQGVAASFLIINTDITEKKKLEAQFLRTQRMESIGTLAGGIAHDLNNVLTPVLMGAEMLHMMHKDAGSQSILKNIRGSAKRGAEMVKQVLTFARGVEGEKKPVQLAHLIKEMEKIMRETFPKSIQTQVNCAAGLNPVLGDSTQIHQILLNFCVNARDAMPEGGRLSVEAVNASLDGEKARALNVAPGEYVRLSVADSGTGIPPEILEKIFEPFFTTKEIGKGTGLGLSTVVTIIKDHKGVLDVQTELGRGTTFSVYLPAIPGSTVTEEAAIDPASLQGRSERILIADDEPAVRELVVATLNQHGYQTLTALHGAEALSVLAAQDDGVDLLILDAMMPVLDGAATLRELRKLEPNLPVLFISGVIQSENLKEFVGTAHVAFLAKPFTPEQLLKTVRELLTESREQTATSPGQPTFLQV